MNQRARSVDFNLNIDTACYNAAKNTFIYDTSKNQFTQPKQQFLNKRIFMLQEELNKTRHELEQCQGLRKADENKIHQLEQSIKRYNDIRKKQSNSKCVLNQVELINQITLLQASESQLKDNLCKEKCKINMLNEQMLELNRKIFKRHNADMKDSLENGLDSANSSVHITINTPANVAQAQVKQS